MFKIRGQLKSLFYISEYVGMNTSQHRKSRNLRIHVYSKTACLVLISGIQIDLFRIVPVFQIYSVFLLVALYSTLRSVCLHSVLDFSNATTKTIFIISNSMTLISLLWGHSCLLGSEEDTMYLFFFICLTATEIWFFLPYLW